MRVKIGGEVMTMKIAFVIIATFILSLGLFANESDTLMNALKNDDINKAKELIMSGVNINTRNMIGETPLMEAAEKGYTEIVELLLNKRVNINISNVKNITALSKAAYNGHTDIVKLLVNADATLNIRDRDGKTALTYAFENEYKDIVKILKKAGAVK